MAQNKNDILAILTDAYSGTKTPGADIPKRGRGRPKSDHWRLDFSPDNGTIRARLRRGSGKNRANVKENGIIIRYNFMPLGTIEEVYSDKTYRQWQKRCEGYCNRTGYQFSGARNSDAVEPAKTGMAGIKVGEWGGFEVYQPTGTDD